MRLWEALVAMLVPVLAALLSAWLAGRRAPQATEAGPRERGMLLCLAGRHSEALPLMTLAVSARPRDAWARYFRGRALAGLGRHRDALADLVAAARMDPRIRPLLPPIARLALLLGRWASLHFLALSWRVLLRLGLARTGWA